MANSNSPFGFATSGHLEGSAPTQGLSTRTISSGYTTAIYSGDAIIPLSTGYIGQAAAAGAVQLAGVFMGCKYLNSSLGRTVWSPYWPGSGAGGDVVAYINADPDASFRVQAYNTAITFADIGNNVDIHVAAGNTYTGFSGMTADQSTLGATTTLPFRIVGLQNSNLPGGDTTTAYNQIFVTFNYQAYKTQTGVA